jgi:hypothetical protein
VYYSHTQQAKRVCDVMAEELRGRGCEVTQAGIEFTDPRYAKNFKTFPFKHAVFSILPLLWPQLLRKTGQIQIPGEAKTDDYDLVCIGSPTWWFRACMPVRSYLRSDDARKVLAGKPFGVYIVCRRYWSINLKEVRQLGTADGGEYVDGIRFTYEGGQVRSLLSLLSYFGTGEMRERALGIKIPRNQSEAGLRRPGTGVRESVGRHPQASGLGRPALRRLRPACRGLTST